MVRFLVICKYFKHLKSQKIEPLSLCRSCSYNFVRNYSFKSSSELIEEYEDKVLWNEFKETFKEKVIYHSFYKYENFVLQKKKQFISDVKKVKNLDKIDLTPVSLKYILEDENKSEFSNEIENTELKSDELKEPIVLPYEVSKVNVSETNEGKLKDLKINEEGYTEEFDENDEIKNLVKDRSSPYIAANSKKWMKDYDCYEEAEDSDVILGRDNKYGTPDINIPMSSVPCGGCGALLHCQDPGIPGYLPSEIFTSCNVPELRSITCQRCHFMKNYNTALSVSVDPAQYPRLLSQIRNEKALVILLVDITDFPCSVWPGILDIIGPRRPLFVIGNKVDLIVGDRKGWMRRAKESLKAALPTNANIKYCSLISAKTGFGVEELINKLHNIWEYKGDVYLVGCTNVGKSTLFNALLKSDYCKVQAADLLQRATTAPWPGTTMNLLKFPVLRPSGVRLYLRTQRLIEDKKTLAAERELWNIQNSKAAVNEPVQLVGHIGRTFSKGNEFDDEPDPFQSSKRIRTHTIPESGLNPNATAYKESRWCFDTPGVLHPDQIINLLTTDEILKALPKSPIQHRVFVFRPNWTIFIAGLGRLDFIQFSSAMNKNNSIKIAVFTPPTLPVTICETEKADSLYNEYIGTSMFVIPSGDPERLKVWPHLKAHSDIVLQGKSLNESCADIVLSNAGWMSITANEKDICKFRAWTPDARGIYVREIPLLRYATNVHGARVLKTPAYSRKYLLEAINRID